MKVVVIDDDPTGSQTVRHCPLLLRWDQLSLRRGLQDPSPLLFLLANTRALDPERAEARNRQICAALRQAMAAEQISAEDVILVSRGDSTLRGHGVLEPQVIEQELGPFDATLHVPAFLEGGRTTVNGVHLLNGEPVHTTEFARDRLFGYGTSDLAEWLQQKSGGSIAAASVAHLSLALLDQAVESQHGHAQRNSDQQASDQHGMQRLIGWLEALDHNRPVVVDAERPEQLAVLAEAIRGLQGRKRFLFRSAASLLNGLADQPPQQPCADLALLRRKGVANQSMPGLVLVGSHVPLADLQLQELLQRPQCEAIELPVAKLARVFEGGSRDFLMDDLEAQWRQQLQQVLARGKTPVLYTSRGELSFPSAATRLGFGRELAELMARLSASVADQLGYLISKGGITTHTLLEKGLNLPAVALKGQLLPGLSLVCAELEGKQDLPILTFPGNLGDQSTLRQAWELMEGLGMHQCHDDSESKPPKSARRL